MCFIPVLYCVALLLLLLLSRFSRRNMSPSLLWTPTTWLGRQGYQATGSPGSILGPRSLPPFLGEQWPQSFLRRAPGSDKAPFRSTAVSTVAEVVKTNGESLPGSSPMLGSKESLVETVLPASPGRWGSCRQECLGFRRNKNYPGLVSQMQLPGPNL